MVGPDVQRTIVADNQRGVVTRRVYGRHRAVERIAQNGTGQRTDDGSPDRIGEDADSMIIRQRRNPIVDTLIIQPSAIVQQPRHESVLVKLARLGPPFLGQNEQARVKHIFRTGPRRDFFGPEVALHAFDQPFLRIGQRVRQHIEATDARERVCVLFQREIEPRLRTEDDLTALPGGRTHGLRFPRPPPHDRSTGNGSAFQYLVPADHAASAGFAKALHTVHEPRLKSRFVRQPFGTHTGLTVGTTFPVALIDLVAAHVNIFIGEKFEKLFPDAFAERQRPVLAHAQRRGEGLPPRTASETGQPRIAVDGLQAMSGHIDFGNHVDTPNRGIGHHLADILPCIISPVKRVGAIGPQPPDGKQEIVVLFPRRAAHAQRVLPIEKPPCPLLREFGITRNLNPPALIVGQMPMKFVELEPGHLVQQRKNLLFVEKVPAPKGDPEAPLQCLIFDSVFNPFRGIIAYFKVVNGVIRKGDHVKFIATGKEYDADEVGVLKLTMSPRDEIRTGDVGYIISGIKTSREVRVGDTITHVARPAKDAIAGFEEVKPMVFAGVYPIDSEDFENLRASLEKLQLNDASLTFQPESSAALGFGFRCGFLGLLHMEIVQERLDREFNMDVITTVPNVSYKVYDKKGNCTEVHNPGGLPDPTLIDHIDEPYIRASVITNTTFIGPIMTLCLGKRGILIKQEYISGDRVEIHYDMPLGEIVIDFYDKLKSISKGYASFDYHIHDFRPSKLVKLDILLNGEPVDALSTLTHMDNSVAFGRRMCEKLKELIPRQQFDIAIQAAIGAKIIARETIKAVRKDVTAKCYGGDISRKRKLLEKQKEGKKRMKQIGTVEVPQKAFLAVLKLD